jgi:hypothetical protein
VIPDIDIWRAALLMLKRYGADAAVEAAARADELLDVGDIDGARVCQRIANAIDHLQAETPADGEKVH